ncbi:hypothetical protein B488_05430 [Liberibacter crescens BT-1]|uniref:Transmembrane protein n=1 Tax=Liberibacter crescens (strain BT-1) TaxID=1215343 RepID=L0EUM9_LIBCB|nr:hypothetical protein B488_05430 [Liberibacter crescens BT-1]
MNFIAPWKEIRFRFNSPTFWKINILATLNGMFFAGLTVCFAVVMHILIRDMTRTINFSFLQEFIVILIFSLFYVGITFQCVVIQTIAFFIPVCLCNFFLNANGWATIVYYTLLILPLMVDPLTFSLALMMFLASLIVGVLYAMIVALLFFFIPVCLCNLFLNTNRWGTIVYYTFFTFLMFYLIYPLRPFLSSMFTVICSVFLPGAILGYTLWRHCLLYYTDLNDDDRERLPIIPSWEVCRPIINVLRNLLMVLLLIPLIVAVIMTPSLSSIKH